MADITETSVVVVGGSLVGLSAALFVSHWKVPVILVERHLGSSLHPRAIGYTARTIELLRSVGVDHRLPASRFMGGPPKRVVVQSLAGEWQKEQAWTKPSASPPGAAHGKGNGTPPDLYLHSPVTGHALPQDGIEPVLRERARELGAELRLGNKAISWTQDDSSVTVTTQDREGTVRTIKAKYLIACDGAHSPIRESLGITRSGVGHIRCLRSILFRCPKIEKYLDFGYSQFQIEGAFEGLLTTYGDGRWMLAWHDLDAKEEEVKIDQATQKDWIRKAAGLELAEEDIELITTGQWDIAGLIADTFSAGRIFLAGDAAHTLPPNRGGYGANTGFADAHNLAWKMASVLKGTSTPDLLKTYDEERRPVARVRHDQIFARPDYSRFLGDKEWPGKGCEILQDDAMEFGQRYQTGNLTENVEDDKSPLARTPDEWKGAPGTRAPHVKLRKGEDTLSTLDLVGTDWTLLSHEISWKGSVESACQETGISLKFMQIGEDMIEENPGSFMELFGLSQTGASLIRPDGFVAWRQPNRGDQGQEELTKVLKKVAFSARS